MRLEPKANTKEDPYKDLSPVQKITRKVAIAVAFVGVFVWFFKIVF